MPGGLLERGSGGSIFDLNGFLPSGEASEARSLGMRGRGGFSPYHTKGRLYFTPAQLTVSVNGCKGVKGEELLQLISPFDNDWKSDLAVWR